MYGNQFPILCIEVYDFEMWQTVPLIVSCLQQKCFVSLQESGEQVQNKEKKNTFIRGGRHHHSDQEFRSQPLTDWCFTDNVTKSFSAVATPSSIVEQLRHDRTSNPSRRCRHGGERLRDIVPVAPVGKRLAPEFLVEVEML